MVTPVYININAPQSWAQMSQEDLRFLYKLLASNMDQDQVKTIACLHWAAIEVIGQSDNGRFLVRRRNMIFEVEPLQIAEILPFFDFIANFPEIPVRLDRIRRKKALPADFSEVPFESFIICDNLYQGYLQTEDDNLLDQLGAVLYGKEINFKQFERISIFFWFASLKNWLAKKYPDFFQPMNSVASGNLLGSPSLSVEAAMNAQIRALTKGDVTKEYQVLALDTHRALTELNAQARDYQEINRQIKK